MATNRINRGKNIRVIMILLLLAVGIYSCNVQAQSMVLGKQMKYLGFEASFGSRSFVVNSSIKAIDGMKAFHTGGAAGVAFGNDVLLTRIKMGYYAADGNTPKWQDIFESTVQVNFYPLEYFNLEHRNVRPYLLAGLAMTNVNFHGTYLDRAKNYQGAFDPFLGKVSQWSGQGAVGVEYAFASQCDFIHLFAEVGINKPISLSTGAVEFKNTSLSQFVACSVGVSFGIKNWKRFGRN